MSKIIDWKYKKLKNDMYIIWYENINYDKIDDRVDNYNIDMGYDKLEFNKVSNIIFIPSRDFEDREIFNIDIAVIDKYNPSKDDIEILSDYEFKEFVKIMDYINKEETIIEKIIDTNENFTKLVVNKNDNKIKEEIFDNVNKPNHYQLNIKGNNIQVIDIIDEVVKDYEPQEAFKIANVIKYVLRASKKNGKEDLKKARKYIDMLLGD